jgi:hypothetical protein
MTEKGSLGESATRPVIVAAGRRVDAPETGAIRFPPQNVPEVRRKIGEFLKRERPAAVVASAACGADLLLLQASEEFSGTNRYILLPSPPEEFRKSSVTDRPGDWGEIYSRALMKSDVQVLKLPGGQEGYLQTNTELLNKAQSVGEELKTTVHALVIWNKQSRGDDDVTAHFLEEARKRNLAVTEISTT